MQMIMAALSYDTNRLGIVVVIYFIFLIAIAMINERKK